MSRHYPWPSDLYLEGGDQYRGWFQSSLLCAMGTHGTPPYKGVVTPGGRSTKKAKPCRSRGVMTWIPVDIASRLGGEIVRLWVASVDFREDVVGSEALMLRVAENYRKIRNTFRYVLGNLYDFDPREGCGAVRRRWKNWISTCCAQTCGVRGRCRQCVRRICVSQDLSPGESFLHCRSERLLLRCAERSALYFRAEVARRAGSAQTAIWRIGEALVRLLAPIMTFTCEEIWPYLPKIAERVESVHVAQFPRPEELFGNAGLSAS